MTGNIAGLIAIAAIALGIWMILYFGNYLPHQRTLEAHHSFVMRSALESRRFWNVAAVFGLVAVGVSLVVLAHYIYLDILSPESTKAARISVLRATMAVFGSVVFTGLVMSSRERAKAKVWLLTHEVGP